MLFTSHDLGSVAGIADRITVLYRMSVAELDTAQAVVQRRRHPYSRLWRRRRPLANGSISAAQRDRLRAERNTGR